MSIRSIETLVRDYPNKTGAEILAMQEADKANNRAKAIELNKENIEFLESLKKERKFLKGLFGLNQRYYHRIDKVEHALDKNDDFVVIETTEINYFKPDETNRGVIQNGEYQLEVTHKSYYNLSDAVVYFGNMTAVDEKEFNDAYNVIKNFENFFANINS